MMQIGPKSQRVVDSLLVSSDEKNACSIFARILALFQPHEPRLRDGGDGPFVMLEHLREPLFPLRTQRPHVLEMLPARSSATCGLSHIPSRSIRCAAARHERASSGEGFRKRPGRVDHATTPDGEGSAGKNAEEACEIADIRRGKVDRNPWAGLAGAARPIFIWPRDMRGATVRRRLRRRDRNCARRPSCKRSAVDRERPPP